MALSLGILRQYLPVRKELPRVFIPNASFATVLVGPEETRFVVHEALLVYHSDFFRAALTGRFREATEKIVRLPDEDVKVFQLFVHWLYYGRFPDADKYDSQDIVDLFIRKRGGISSSGESLVHLYVFGDRRGVSALRRQALDIIATGAARSWPMHFRTISYASDNLVMEDPLCRLLADIVTSRLSKTEWEKLFARDGVAQVKRCSEELLRGCIIAFASVFDGKTAPKRKFFPCDYHNHKDDEEREACEASKV